MPNSIIGSYNVEENVNAFTTSENDKRERQVVQGV